MLEILNGPNGVAFINAINADFTAPGRSGAGIVTTVFGASGFSTPSANLVSALNGPNGAALMTTLNGSNGGFLASALNGPSGAAVAAASNGPAGAALFNALNGTYGNIIGNLLSQPSSSSTVAGILNGPNGVAFINAINADFTAPGRSGAGIVTTVFGASGFSTPSANLVSALNRPNGAALMTTLNGSNGGFLASALNGPSGAAVAAASNGPAGAALFNALNGTYGNIIGNLLSQPSSSSTVAGILNGPNGVAFINAINADFTAPGRSGAGIVTTVFGASGFSTPSANLVSALNGPNGAALMTALNGSNGSQIVSQLNGPNGAAIAAELNGPNGAAVLAQLETPSGPTPNTPTTPTPTTPTPTPTTPTPTTPTPTTPTPTTPTPTTPTQPTADTPGGPNPTPATPSPTYNYPLQAGYTLVGNGNGVWQVITPSGASVSIQLQGTVNYAAGTYIEKDPNTPNGIIFYNSAMGGIVGYGSVAASDWDQFPVYPSSSPTPTTPAPGAPATPTPATPATPTPATPTPAGSAPPGYNTPGTGGGSPPGYNAPGSGDANDGWGSPLGTPTPGGTGGAGGTSGASGTAGGDENGGNNNSGGLYGPSPAFRGPVIVSAPPGSAYAGETSLSNWAVEQNGLINTLTPVGAVPTFGNDIYSNSITAGCSSNGTGAHGGTANCNGFSFSGTASLNVNFATGTFSSTIVSADGSVGGSISGTVIGNTFSGSYLPSPKAGSPPVVPGGPGSGIISGGFYGPQAQLAIATLSIIAGGTNGGGHTKTVSTTFAAGR